MSAINYFDFDLDFWLRPTDQSLTKVKSIINFAMAQVICHLVWIVGWNCLFIDILLLNAHLHHFTSYIKSRFLQINIYLLYIFSTYIRRMATKSVALATSFHYVAQVHHAEAECFCELLSKNVCELAAFFTYNIMHSRL